MRQAFIILGLAALMAAGFVLRLRHADSDLSQSIQTLDTVSGFWGDPGEDLDLNPHSFTRPSLSYYLQFGEQAGRYFVLSLLGKVESLNDFRQLLRQDTGIAAAHGRGVLFCLSVLCVVPVFLLARGVWGSPAAWIGAALALTLPASMVYDLDAGPDLACALFTTAALASMALLGTSGRREAYLWSGLFLGLAASAGYLGLVLLAALVVVHTVRVHREGGGPLQALGAIGLWEGLFVAAVAFAITSPYVLLDFQSFLADAAGERARLNIGHLGLSGDRTWLFYLTRGFPVSWTWPVCILSLAGITAALIEPRGRIKILPAVVFGGAAFLIVGSWRSADPRMLLPLYPAACAAAGGALWALGRRLPNRASIPAAVAAGSVVVAVTATAMLDAQRAHTGRDSRAAALEWMQEEIPSGAAVLLEQYGPEPRPGIWNLLQLPFHATHPHTYDPAYSPVLYTTFDYLVLSSAMYGRYLQRPHEYPAQTTFYNDLMLGFEEVVRFASGEYSGPTIRILRRKPDGTLKDLSHIPRSFFDDLKGRTAVADYFSRLAGVLAKQGRDDLGYLMLDEAEAIDSESATVWLNRGLVHLDRGNLESALLALRRSRDLNPKDPQVWYVLASLQNRQGEFRQAADSYRRVIELDRSHEEAWIGLARVLVEDVRYGEARLMLNEFLSRFPRSPRRADVETALKELSSMGPGRP